MNGIFNINLWSRFRLSVLRTPNHVAFVDDVTRVSYAEWLDKITRLIKVLREKNLSQGDRVLCRMQNSLELATLYWACQYLGVIFVPINWRTSPQETEFLIGDCGAKLAVIENFDGSFCFGSHLNTPDILCDASIVTEALKIPYESPSTFQFMIDLQDSIAKPEDCSVILYTSGTTGPPKGVVRSHRSEIAATNAHVNQNSYKFGEVMLGVMPVYHTMGLRVMLASALVGGTFVCMRKFDSSEALKLIEREKITALVLVPTLLHSISTDPEFRRTDFASVRAITSAGSALTTSLATEINAFISPSIFTNQYGSTEIYTFTVNQNAVFNPVSVGRAGIFSEVRLVNLQTDSILDLAEKGDEGEIIIRMTSEEAFSGYWGRDISNEKSIKDGWYFSGDTAIQLDNNEYVVTGRKDDLIITGGENVSPVRVEERLLRNDEILEVAVFGIKNEKWGEIVAAAIVSKCEIELDDILEFCRTEGLMPHQCPRVVYFIDKLPKSSVGKILRRVLRDKYKSRTQYPDLMVEK